MIERKREMREKDTYIVIKGYTVRKRAIQKKVTREGGEQCFKKDKVLIKID